MIPDEQQEAVNYDVKLLKQQFKSLKKQVKELKDQSERVTLMGLQDQITQLNEKINQIEDSLIKSNRFIAEFQIFELYTWVETRIHKYFWRSEKSYEEAHDLLEQNYSATMQALSTSKAPLSVYMAFHKHWFEYFKEHNIKGFKKNQLA